MKTKIGFVGLPLILLSLTLAGGCTASRGNFVDGSCAAGDRKPVPANSAYAIYVDADGKPIGRIAEDLTGTEANRMCPTPEPDDPGACKAHYCPKTINGTTYCLRC